jgi:hypothetical protein
MALLPASLYSGQTLVAGQLSVELVLDGGMGKDSRWNGSFKVRPDVSVSIGSTYELMLADGRGGDILVTRLTYGGSSDDVKVQFRGSGELRKRGAPDPR